jgi:PleD family two-component response regulator
VNPLALLIGNREALMQPLRDWLEPAGYSLITASSGKEGLTRARKESPQLIVADAELPDLSSVELCHLLRADTLRSPATPILVASRDEIVRERRLAVLRAGAWECLVWPWDPDAVLLRLRTYVQGKVDLERARADGLVDPVTGLYNSRGLARRAREMGSHAFRSHQPLACVMLSIELAPDAASVPASELLSPVATALQAIARPSDPKGRVSSTEFAIFAAGTDEAGAERMATRLSRAVENAIEVAGVPSGTFRVKAAYEAVANLTYSPMEPTELLTRATATLHATRPSRSTGPRRLTND